MVRGCIELNTRQLGKQEDLGKDGSKNRPQPLHSALLLQIVHCAVPVKVDNVQGRPCKLLSHPPHTLSKVFAEQQLILALQADGTSTNHEAKQGNGAYT